MFIETWYKCQCPDCKAWNWVYDTHSERSYSNNDMLALKCWKCSACNWMFDEAIEEARFMHGVGWTEEAYLEEYGDLEGYQSDAKIDDVAQLGIENP